MKITLEINNLAKSLIKDAFLKSVASETLKVADLDFLKNKNISVSLAIVEPTEIKKLNKKYRQKDKVTDVLSFAEYKNLAAIRKSVDKSLFLGEIILCYDDIKQYAKKEGLVFKQELAQVVAHGILHLLGFSHSRRMFAIQNKVKNLLLYPKRQTLEK